MIEYTITIHFTTSEQDYVCSNAELNLKSDLVEVLGCDDQDIEIESNLIEE